MVATATAFNQEGQRVMLQVNEGAGEGDNETLYTTREAAEQLGVHQSRVLQLIRDDRLEGAFKKGAIWLIPHSAVQRTLQMQRRVGRPRVVGTRVRTDRINQQIVPQGCQPLTGDERYAVQAAVANEIGVRRITPTSEEMIGIGERELRHKDWPDEIRRRVVAMIIFGRLPTEV